MMVDGIEVSIVAEDAQLALRCRAASGGIRSSNGWLRKARATTPMINRTMTSRRRYQMLGGWCHHWENHKERLDCALWWTAPCFSSSASPIFFCLRFGVSCKRSDSRGKARGYS